MIKKINPRSELIYLMRGFFSLPVVISLSNNGVLEKILTTQVNVEKFKNIKNKKFLNSIFNYLANLGILEKNLFKGKENFKVTILGKKILSRVGSFHLLNSYSPFINNLDKILDQKSTTNIRCNREENVLGSGLTNGRKFFPKSFEFFKKDEFDVIADIGCGDGEYLSRSIKYFSKADFFASDISKKALSECKKKLKKNLNRITFFKSDAFDVKKWSKILNKLTQNNNKRVLITMWYVVHEISKNDKHRIINFFKEIKKSCPNANILIGEIINIDHLTLSQNRNISILPEFLFFHEISGQGVLKISDFDFIKKNIPYNLSNSYESDYVKNNNKKTPSAIIWHLSPKE